MKRTKKKKEIEGEDFIYVGAWAVVFKQTREIYTATDGMGIFQIRKWAVQLSKIIGQEVVEVVPVSLKYKI